MKALFCYRISKEANLAYNTETGESAECYIGFFLKDDNDNIIDISEDLYHEKHAQFIPYIAKQAHLEEEWIEPISIEEYEENQDD